VRRPPCPKRLGLSATVSVTRRSPGISRVGREGFEPSTLALRGAPGSADPKPPSDHYDIWVINADGTDLTNVTDSPRQLEDYPTWSPSGRFLAFESRNRNTVRSLEVHTIRVDGTHRRNVSRASGRDEGPHWSPDGRSIVFSSIRDGRMDIWLTTATGKTPSNLTSHPEGSQNWWPQWSP